MTGRTDDGNHKVTGTERKQINATAVRANIKVMNTWVAGGEGAYGHVQLTNPGNYVSMGWVEFAGGHGNTHAIVRWWIPGDGPHYAQLEDLNYGDEPRFAVWEDFTYDHFVFYLNGQERLRLPPNDPDFTMFTPNSASIHARISSYRTQMPGESFDRMEITNAEFRVGSGSLMDFTGSKRNDDSSHFGMAKIDYRHYQTWDKCE